MPLVEVADSWDNGGMTVPNKAGRSYTAPALYRLLAESALSRAALGCCGIPLAMLDADAKGRPVTYVNAAFEAFFGYRETEALGRSLAALVLHNDEPLVQRLLNDPPKRWEISAWGKDGEPRHVEVALAGLRDADGRLTHWVVVFSDRTELEKLRAEVESLKSLAAASLGVRLEPASQPARSAQKPRVEVPAADELHPDRQAAGILHQR
jgi:PAS domain S-box-containing protein